MITLAKILLLTIKDFENRRRFELDDYSFDAFSFLAEQIGHKNPSTLRKMTEPRRSGSHQAKLGLEEAMTIMIVTGDYRLFAYMKEEIEAARAKQSNQLALFSQPIRQLSQLIST